MYARSWRVGIGTIEVEVTASVLAWDDRDERTGGLGTCRAWAVVERMRKERRGRKRILRIGGPKDGWK